jgi:hypothetical protein
LTVPITVDERTEIAMRRPRFQSLALLPAILGFAVSAFAQQQSDAAPAHSSTTVSNPVAAPSASTASPASTETLTPTAPDAPKIVVNVIPRKEETPDVPSADTLKKARQAGYHTKVSHGVLYFCKQQAEVGTRFSKEYCADENTLLVTLQREETQRDQFQHTGGCSGSGCSGK